MGLLRLLFALFVVLFHIAPQASPPFLSGYQAVWSFFVISGFYMALILNGKYIGRNSSFYLYSTNRILRIYPSYFFVLIITIVLALIFYYLKIPNVFSEYLSSSRNITDVGWDVLRNITLIVGPEWVYSPQYPNYLLLPQAWTLQLELMFYCIAPLLFVRKRRYILLVLAGIVAFDYLFVFPYKLFYSQPFIYKFFESVIFFLLGGISFYIYNKINTYKINAKVLIGIFLSFLFYILFYNALQLQVLNIFGSQTDWTYYLLLVLVLPFIFMLTKRNRFDMLIGELSYPVYISHIFIVTLVSSLFSVEYSFAYAVLIIVAVLVFSSGIVVLIDRPIDLWRQKRLVKSKKLV